MIEGKVKKIGKLVRKVRREQGLTQVQLAGVSGTGVRFIRELEQGKESCHIGKALTVVAMLGIDVELNGEAL